MSLLKQQETFCDVSCFLKRLPIIAESFLILPATKLLFVFPIKAVNIKEKWETCCNKNRSRFLNVDTIFLQVDICWIIWKFSNSKQQKVSRCYFSGDIAIMYFTPYIFKKQTWTGGFFSQCTVPFREQDLRRQCFLLLPLLRHYRIVHDYVWRSCIAGRCGTIQRNWSVTK